MSPPAYPRAALWSLAAVCFFWGTTYLGIRVALEGLTPIGLVASRFLLSGGLILAFGLFRRWPLPRGRALLWPIATGLLTLGVGNYCLTLAETYVPSGLAALIITVGPFWMVGLDVLVPGGERPRPQAFLGMLIGFAGALWLIAPDTAATGFDGNTLRGFFLLQLSCAAWSLGSVLQKRQPNAAHPFVTGAIQQLTVGLLASLLWGVQGFSGDSLSPQVLGAVLYLALFGSIVAYSAFLYSLQHLPMTLVSIYTYVNPVVAVSLGWLYYREAFGWRELSAMAVIFSGVWLVKKLSR